jgi:para-nitrobenzyl esterase
MRSIFTVGLALLLAGAPVAVAAQPAGTPPATPAKTYSVEDSTIGDLLDDPAAKAVLDKDLPGFASNPQIDMARSMTLKQIQQYAADQLTDAKLAVVQADLNKLPPKK